jgi:hypothetical protein
MASGLFTSKNKRLAGSSREELAGSTKEPGAVQGAVKYDTRCQEA